jgi:hypothetical protein
VRPPVSDKTRIIERKLQEANIKGQKPGISVLAQGFHPSRESLANQVKQFILLISHSF